MSEKLKVGFAMSENVNSKGFYLTLEAMISFIVLVMIVIAAGNISNSKNNEIYILQKENDLLKIWFVNGLDSELEIISDFEFAFPNNCKSLEINGIRMFSSEMKCMGDAVSSSGTFINEVLQVSEIKLTVFY